jgi:hypothetical protein
MPPVKTFGTGESPPPDPSFATLGLPVASPPPPTARPTLGGPPVVSSTPTPGQGVATDTAGNLPLSIVQLQVGYAFSYVELQSAALITATTEATANTVVTAASITLDGATSICVRFASYRVDRGTTFLVLVLYDAVGTGAAASLGRIGVCDADLQPFSAERFFTPRAGVHTFSVRAFVDAGTGAVQADTGGSGKGMPAYIRVTRA